MYATLHCCAAQWLWGQSLVVLIPGGNSLFFDAVNGFIKVPPQYTKLLRNVRSSLVLYKASSFYTKGLHTIQSFLHYTKPFHMIQSFLFNPGCLTYYTRILWERLWHFVMLYMVFVCVWWWCMGGSNDCRQLHLHCMQTVRQCNILLVLIVVLLNCHDNAFDIVLWWVSHEPWHVYYRSCCILWFCLQAMVLVNLSWK